MRDVVHHAIHSRVVHPRRAPHGHVDEGFWIEIIIIIIFSEEKLGDPGAFTNRAPYPLLHILREKDVTEAVNSHPNVRGIPKANVERMREIGNESLKRMLDGLRSL